MPLWNKTSNQLLEKRNAFLRDLAHGLSLVYRTKQTVGGTWDHVTETMVGGTVQDVDQDFGKAVLIMPVKSLGDADSNDRTVVSAGIKINGVDFTKSSACRMHPKVPLNFDALYVMGGRQYRLTHIFAVITIGSLPCWNEVLLTEA